MVMHAREDITPELKKLEKLKHSPSTKSTTTNKFTTKRKKYGQMLRPLRQNKNN